MIQKCRSGAARHWLTHEAARKPVFDGNPLCGVEPQIDARSAGLLAGFVSIANGTAPGFVDSRGLVFLGGFEAGIHCLKLDRC